jgi:hypothetical protein
MRSHTIKLLALALLGTLCLGCGDSVAPDSNLTAESKAPSAMTPALPEESVESKAAPESEKPAIEQPTDNQVASTYEPPFPDRVDLFRAPKRQGKVLVKSKGHVESSVELLGFVNVDKQRVVLAINGQVAPIAEGGEYSGIEVISIQPPKVVLQRGRQRWQTTLTN